MRRVRTSFLLHNVILIQSVHVEKLPFPLPIDMPNVGTRGKLRLSSHLKVGERGRAQRKAASASQLKIGEEGSAQELRSAGEVIETPQRQTTGKKSALTRMAELSARRQHRKRTEESGEAVVPLKANTIGRRDLVLAMEEDIGEAGLQHDDVVEFALGFNQTRYLLQGPDEVASLLQSADTDKDGVTRAVKPLLRDGIITAPAETWIKRRRELQPLLSQDFTKSATRTIAETAQELAEYLEKYHVDAEPVDMEALLRSLALDVAGRTMFSFRFNAFRGGTVVERAALDRLASVIAERTIRPVRVHMWPLSRFWMPEERQFRRDIETLNSLLEKVVSSCEPGDGTVVDGLMSSGREGEGLREDVINVLFAGHETTGAAMTWLLYCLAQCPQQLAAVRSEIDALFDSQGDEPPSFEQVYSLEKTRCAVAEALRMFPSPPRLARRLRSEHVLPNGKHLPASTFCIVNINGLHNRDDLWCRPHEFNIFRWQEEVAGDWLRSSLYPPVQATSNRFQPFASGPRSCLGASFAALEATLATSILLRRFEFHFASSPASAGIRSNFASLSTANGLLMRVRSRG